MGRTDKRGSVHKLWLEKAKESKEAWEKAEKGDKVLIYCTRIVKPYPKQISHTGVVREVNIAEEKAVMKLEVGKLPSGVPLNIIGEKVESGELSEKMGRCGTPGFNICVVEESDFKQIEEMGKNTDVNARVRAEKEREIQAYFELNLLRRG